MASAMDREFYKRPVIQALDISRRRDVRDDVVTGIHRVSQLSAAIQLVTPESLLTVLDKLEEEVSWLSANATRLRAAVEEPVTGNAIISVRDRAVVKAAERIIAAVRRDYLSGNRDDFAAPKSVHHTDAWELGEKRMTDSVIRQSNAACKTCRREV